MKIHALCIVKNEADVIEECLEAAAHWCDHIYVFDNGSCDGTWEKVLALATRLPQVVPFKQEAAPFRDGLRADIHEAYRDRTVAGDWWCRLDADEFYIDDPRIFLAKVPPSNDYVVTASFSYYFTEKDAQAWEEDPVAFHAMPVQRRLRHYVNHWSEPRFMRADPARAWGPDRGGWPEWLHAGRAYPVRLWVKHFCYRSPEQIERRLASRRGAIESGTAFGHEAVADFAEAVANVRHTREGFARTGLAHATLSWRDRIVPSSSLNFDALDHRLVVNEALMPPVPGTGRRHWLRRLASSARRRLLALRLARPATTPRLAGRAS